MKSTGIVRKIDPIGRIVIPKELRDLLNISNDSKLEILVDKDKILLSKYQDKCYICDIKEELISFKGKMICRNCIDMLCR